MPAKKPLKAAPVENVGAPANAAKLEAHARDAEEEVIRVKGRLQALRELQHPNSNTEEQKDLAGQVERLQRELEGAYDLWFKLSKQVLDYDKKVDAARREGESIPRLLVETILTQTWRFQRLGRENFCIAIAQDAIRCRDEQEFYSKYAESIRQCELTSLKDAIDHEKAPTWVLMCYQNSL